MFLDNSQSTSRWMFAETLTMLIGTALIIYSNFDNENSNNYFIAGIVLVVAFMIMLWINPSYFYFNVDDKYVDIRNMSAFPVLRKPKQYKFPKQGLVSYEFPSGVFGLQKLLVFTVKGLDPKTKKPVTVIAEPINITALSKKAVADLENTLKKLVKAK